MTEKEIIGQRLKELRQSVKLSQAKLAKTVHAHQSAIVRYEMGEAHVPADIMLNYANYFDVSLDYIYGRTDKPQGATYTANPKIEESYPGVDKFIEMCFDPGSVMNERLKATLKQMMREEQTDG